MSNASFSLRRAGRSSAMATMSRELYGIRRVRSAKARHAERAKTRSHASAGRSHYSAIYTALSGDTNPSRFLRRSATNAAEQNAGSGTLSSNRTLSTWPSR